MKTVCLRLPDDPFKKHFTDLDEADLAQQISDVQDDKLLGTVSKGSFWYFSTKQPRSLSTSLSHFRIPQTTRDLDVISTLSNSMLLLITV